MSTISIIGSGTMATAIAGRVAKAGHTVEVVGRDPAKARALADQLGAGATTGTYGAAPRATSSSSPCRTAVQRRRWPTLGKRSMAR
jgi:pyrroline-5-carboxylate reductase